MISVRAVTKRYGGSTAVEDLSFEVRPGVVTGLLADTTVAELTRGGAVSLSDAFLALTGTQPNDEPRAVAL